GAGVGVTIATTARFAVDPWDPGYAGVSEAGLAVPLDESAAPLNLDVETPASRWRPVPRRTDAAPTVVFVDGVRRVEARVWFFGAAGQVEPGLAASYAAGSAVCDGAARIDHVVVERGLFTASPAASDVRTPCGEVFRARARRRAGSSRRCPRRCSNGCARPSSTWSWRPRASAPQGNDDLLVVDGPLRGREN
ncbi:MAG: hypothetical protein ACM3ZF_09780, partial [Mycobacterium leprae]